MAKALSLHIRDASRQHALDDGTACPVIGIGEVERIAREAGIDGRQVEIAALQDNILPDRYLRNRNAFSNADQLNLLESTVGIVGLGGLGGMVTETLARMGIGRFYLTDGDVFEAHNLNRQLLSRMDTIGVAKADAAKARIKRINPGIDVISKATYLTPENAAALVAPCDIVVDCLDTIQSRFTLQAAAQNAGIPMVSAAIAGMSGHVTTIYPEDTGLETIYGPPAQLQITKGAEALLGCLAAAVNLKA